MKSFEELREFPLFKTFLGYWDAHLFGFIIGDVVVAVTIIFFGFSLRRIFVNFVINYLRDITHKTGKNFKKTIIDALAAPLSFIFIVLGVYLASSVLHASPEMEIRKNQILNSLVIIIIFWSLFRAISPFSFLFDRFFTTVGDGISKELRHFFIGLFKTLIVIIGFLSVLEVWGVKATAVLASLGITGVAVALGAQETLKNYFGTLAIFMDETFRIGDWVKTTDVEGTVEKIGLRSTYIRQFDKALVSVPNGTLTGSAVVNFSKMTHRRVRWIIGIRYDATAEQLENIVNKIRAYLEKNDDIETDLDKVVTIIQIDKFGESAIDIFCYFFTKTTKWLDYMKVKEECVLSFKRIVTEEGTDFALPSRSLYIGTNQSEDLKKSA